eukprot:3065484-Rhodomonas_salina.1
MVSGCSVLLVLGAPALNVHTVLGGASSSLRAAQLQGHAHSRTRASQTRIKCKKPPCSIR